MPWQVVIVPELEVELRAFDGAVRVELLARSRCCANSDRNLAVLMSIRWRDRV
jgi:hypothetical protein